MKKINEFYSIDWGTEVWGKKGYLPFDLELFFISSEELRFFTTIGQDRVIYRVFREIEDILFAVTRFDPLT